MSSLVRLCAIPRLCVANPEVATLLVIQLVVLRGSKTKSLRFLG